MSQYLHALVTNVVLPCEIPYEFKRALLDWLC